MEFLRHNPAGQSVMWPFRNYKADALETKMRELHEQMYDEIEHRKKAEDQVRMLKEDVKYWQEQYTKLNNRAFHAVMDAQEQGNPLGARRCRGCTGDPYQTRCKRGA